MTRSTPWLSVVSPVYLAEGCVEELCRRVIEVCDELAGDRGFELVLLDDASPDASWSVIVEQARRDPRVRGVRLSRNFGQHRALTAALAEARGEIVVVMDCDLQDRPEEIPKLVAAVDGGADLALARREGRQGGFVRRGLSRAFFRVLNLMSRRFAPDQVGTFSAMRSKVAREFLRVADHRSHYLTVLGWMGFESVVVDVAHAERFAGRSSYSLRRVVRHAVDGVVSQSSVLLQASTTLGIVFWLISISQMIYLIVRRLNNPAIVEGWSSLMVVLWFVGGSVLLSLGILGLYLGQVLETSRGRPLYVVGRRTDDEDDASAP